MIDGSDSSIKMKEITFNDPGTIISDIYCTGSTYYAVSQKNVYGWGLNDYNQISRSNREWIENPTPIKIDKGLKLGSIQGNSSMVYANYSK